jgi:prophage DNA circulation protein
MSIKTEFEEIEEIVARTLRNLVAFSNKQGRAGAEMRRTVGDLVARVNIYLADGSFADRLLQCFKLATQAGIDLNWMDRVIKQLVLERPTTLTSTSVVQNSLIYALAQEGRIIAATTYRSRDDVDATMKRMKSNFDTVKFIIADTMSGPGYQAFIELASAVTRYLTDTARPLPRMLSYDMPTTLPALTLSNYIYGTGTRSLELEDENKVVHPAFMPRTLRALNA